MYGIKRNIKKINGKNTVKTGEPMVLESNPYAKHQFIKEDVLPADCYYCVLIHAERTVTKRKQEPAVVAYYIARKMSGCYKIINDKPRTKQESKIYYIKEIYPLNTDYHEAFVSAMRKAKGVSKSERITTEDVIDVEEVVSIEFDGPNGFGSIKKRIPFVYEDYIEEEVEEYEEEDLNEVNCPDGPTCSSGDDENEPEDLAGTIEPETPVPLPDEDDEFDDFFDDIEF